MGGDWRKGTLKGKAAEVREEGVPQRAMGKGVGGTHAETEPG